MAAFFLILVLVIGGAMFASHISTQNVKHKRREADLKKQPLREKKRAFLASQQEDWPYASGMSDELDFMMMSKDTTQLRFVMIRSSGADVELFHDTILPIRNMGPTYMCDPLWN